MSTSTTPEDWANLLKELCWQVARLAWALVGLFYKTVGIVVSVLYLTGHLAVHYIP